MTTSRRRVGSVIGALAGAAALVLVTAMPASAYSISHACESPSTGPGVRLHNTSTFAETFELTGHQCGTVGVKVYATNGTTNYTGPWVTGATSAISFAPSGYHVTQSSHTITSPSYNIWTIGV